MANNISSLPWVLDTASDSPVKAGLTYVRTIIFQGYASAADQAVVQCKDTAGNVITLATLNGQADLTPVSFNEGAAFWTRDLILKSITSGTVNVFV